MNKTLFAISWVLAAAATPLAAEYKTTPSVGEVWHDSQDGHRLEVKAVGGGHVYFADLDDANPQRQWRWTEQHFAERCIPPASPPSASGRPKTLGARPPRSRNVPLRKG